MPRALALLALLLALGLGAEGFSPCARVVGGRSSSRGCRRPRRRHGGAPSRLFSSASPASSVPPSPQPQAQAQLGEGEEEEEEEEAGAEEQVPVPPPRRRMVMTMAGVEKRRRKLEEEAREEELREEEQKKMEKQNRKNKRKASSSSAALVKKKTLAELTVADDEEPRWYLLQVRTGMEKVCETIINRKIEDWGMRDRIERVIVPTRKAPKTRGKSVKVQDVPLYVGYVYFHCRMCQELRDLVGRLPHVAGFTGMHRDENNIRIPDPMPEEQMKIVFDRMEEGESIPDIMASELGIRDAVEIVKGPYKGLTGLLRVVRPDELVVRIFENNQETDVTLEHDGVRKLSTGELEALEAEKERQARTSASLESIANARGVSVRGDRGRDGSYGRFENDLDREKGRFMPKYQRMARAQNAPTSSKKSDRRIGANDWDQQNRRRNEGSSFEPAVVNSDLDSDGNDAWAFLDDIVSSSPTQSESSERVQGDSSGSRDDMAELADILGSTAGEGEQGGWEESLAPKKGSSSQIEPPKSGGDDAFFASLMKELNAEYGISDEAEKGGEDGAAPAADLDDLLAEFSGDEYKPAGAQGGQTNIVEEVGGSSFEDLLSSFEEGGGAEALGVNFSLGGDADEGDANFNFSEEPDSAPVSSKSAGGRREKGAMSSPGDDLDDLLAAFEGGDMDDLDVGLDLSLDKAAVENNAERAPRRELKSSSSAAFDLDSILAELEAVDDTELESLLKDLGGDSPPETVGAARGTLQTAQPKNTNLFEDTDNEIADFDIDVGADLESILASLDIVGDPEGSDDEPEDLDSMLLALEQGLEAPRGGGRKPSPPPERAPASSPAPGATAAARTPATTPVGGLSEASLKKMKVVDLKEELSRRGLKVGGKKDELIARLLASSS